MGVHLEPIHSIFNDCSIGSDLKFADIKTTRDLNQQKYTYYQKDLKVPLMICWNSNYGFGNIIQTIELNNKFRVKSAIKEKDVKILSIFYSNSLEELKQKYDEYEKQLEGKKNE